MVHHNNKKTHFKWNGPTLIKLTVVLIVFVYLARSIYSIVMAQDELHQMNVFLKHQEAQFKQLEREDKAQVKHVQEGLKTGAKDMKEKADEFENHLDNFFQGFTESLNEAMAAREERHKREFIRQFLEDHVRFYDKALYEADRKKAIAEREYSLPTYFQYDEMREKALRCHWESHNQSEEHYYRNKIAQLKRAHQEKLIKNVHKPDLWSWPLTLSLIDKIKTDNFLLFFTVLTKEGTCQE